MRAMIDISDSAQAYFRRLLQSQGGDAVGIRLSASDPGTPRADSSAPFLDAATIDFVEGATGGQLTIRAPKIKGDAPGGDASLVDRVRWILESEVNPQLASHKGRVALESVDADGVVWLRFGGGCHGCGMADMTLKQGIEKTLMAKVPGVTAVRDATDHSTGEAPYMARA